MRFQRRTFLHGLAGTVGAASFPLLVPRRAHAFDTAKRVIFFYFPDGIPAESQNGEGTAWHPSGSTFDFALPDVLSPLSSLKDDCVFFRGLSLGPTDVGSHPGGAKKLLTAKDGGNGWSLDHHLAQTVGSGSPHRHVSLGAMATQNNASGDKFLTYVAPGQTVAPDDNPVAAFVRLFGEGAPVGGGSGGGSGGSAANDKSVSVIDGVLAEALAFKSRLGNTDAAKLDFHLESLREVETRIKTLPPPPVTTSSCTEPNIDVSGVDTAALYDETTFPAILKAQIDLMVTAMACNLTRVGTIQCSHHTSDLYMSAFPSTEMNAFAQCPPSAGLVNCQGKRSHEASHYGASHSGDLYTHYIAQRKWFVSQFAYLVDALKSRPEGDGTMLDNSIVLLMSEVSDGNVHSHDNMGFIMAGKGGGAFSTGKLIDNGYTRHGALLTSIARAMGLDVWSYGDTGDGPINGL